MGLTKRKSPTELDIKLIENAEQLLRIGNYTETVCRYLGMGVGTWYRWMNEGEDAPVGSLKREFHDRVRAAEAGAEMDAVKNIHAAGQRYWQASSWYLERKFPSRWGRQEKVQASIEHSGKDGGPIETHSKQELDLSNLSDKELTQLESIIAKQQDDDDESGQTGTGQEETN